jgi:PAS domain S-box-containing protein
MARVLIVDDRAENRYLLRAMLQGHGHEVEEARHGAEALVLARRSPPDLVVSDLLMPVLDGYALLRQWKADERLEAVPFVVYTATYTEPRDERLALDLGADAFLVKPAEPEPFMACVREVLGRVGRRAPRQSARPEQAALYEAHTEVLLTKLEKRAGELEQSNRELLAEVAERQRAEAALRDSEERYRTLFHAVTEPLFVCDRRTLAFLNVNDAAVARYGYSRDEFLRMTLEDVRPPEGSGAPFGWAGADRGAWRHRKKTGEVIDVEVAVYELEYAGRQACLVEARDVTERRRLEAQLRHAQKMEAVGRLAGGIAHDFNNMLTAINGYSEILLAMPEMGEDVRDAVTTINEAGRRAAALTRQLLGFSRKTVMQVRVIDLNAVVAETGKLLSRLIGEDVKLVTAPAQDLARIAADPTLLEQVLMNLAVNARDAMPTGGKLTIETANVTAGDDHPGAGDDCKAGPHVLLTVADTGCGMSEEVMARLFEPFFTTKEVGKGTGLGLAMVFGIVRQSGGCIHAHSEPGRGATFRLYFPAVAEEPAAREQDADLAAGGGETILLVEDEEAVRGLALLSLRMHGYRVLAAGDGKDALRVVGAHEGPLDLVVSDVVMPNLGGPDLVGELKARFPRLKVLYVSGHADEAVARHGLPEATACRLQKPYTSLGLARKVREVLDEGLTAGKR